MAGQYLKRDLALLIKALGVVADDLTSDPIDGASGGGGGGSTGGIDGGGGGGPPVAGGFFGIYYGPRYYSNKFFE